MRPIRRLLGASAWLFADRFLRLGLSFVVGVLIARHFGPEGFGQINYVIALGAVFGTFSSAGLDDIVPRDMARNEASAAVNNDIQRTALTLRIIGGCLAYILLILASVTVQDNQTVVWIALILGSYFVFQAADIYECRLRVLGLYNRVAQIRFSSAIVGSAFKLGVVFFSNSVLLLACAFLSEFVTNAYLFRRALVERINKVVGQFNGAYALATLKKSWRLALAGVIVMLQYKLEYFMVEYLMDWQSVGQYTAALKVMELFDVIGVIFATALLPEIARASDSASEQNMRRAYLVGLILYFCMIPFICLAIWVFPWVYGQKYNESAALLPFLGIRPLFMLYIAIRGVFVIVEHKYWCPLLSACLGLSSSAILALALIPDFGLTGAVASSVFGLLFSTFVADVFFFRKNLAQAFACVTEFGYLKQTAGKLIARFMP